MSAKSGARRAARREPAPGAEFFRGREAERAAPESRAAALIERCEALAPEVELLISDGPLARSAAGLSPDRLLAALPGDRLRAAESVVELVALLGAEVRPGPYSLSALVEDVAALPAFASPEDGGLARLHAAQARGCEVPDLPADPDAAHATLVGLAQTLGISLEYLLGNLAKAAAVIGALEVRAATLNLSALFHNVHGGLADPPPETDAAMDGAALRARAGELERRGLTLRLFDAARFDAPVSATEGERLETLAREADEGYALPEGTFMRFAGSCVAREEDRQERAPVLSLRALLACFKFDPAQRELVALPAAPGQDDPRTWQDTDLGRALLALRPGLNWLAASTGIKAAGDHDALLADEAARRARARLRELAASHHITLASGRGESRENRLGTLDEADAHFDLYCLAVLEKRAYTEVLDTAVQILELVERLENPGPVVCLDALVSARLGGESFATLLGTQGLVLRSAPVAIALDQLRALAPKVHLAVRRASGAVVNVNEVGIEQFRRAVTLMGRRMRTPHSPERILAVITDRVVPEIRGLPPQVIAGGAHDLERIVELALAGVPARYPLRRPWQKLHLDPLVSLGSCLEPGIRNCLGCPVNSLYGLVMKSAIASGYEEIITYEATGCFEVYSGIWPYTGKKWPSVHGVFGGAPSEMLGGLAAKRARVRHARRGGGVAAGPDRVLHLGWGGDGATFDIGFGNLSGLFSRLQHLGEDDLAGDLHQRALYVCYDNEGYQNTGNQYSAATTPGGNTTTNPRGREHPLGNELRKKPIAEIVAEHGVPLSARMNIHRQEHITRVMARALADGDRGSFLHFLQPCTTGWKFAADSLTYDLSHLAEEGALFVPVTIEHGVPYLEMYPTPRNPGESFLQLQARFRHLLGAAGPGRENLDRVMAYYREEWQRNLRLTGFDGEIPQADRFAYLDDEHRFPRVA